MKVPLKIASGIGGLLIASPPGYGIYYVWDSNNPTGNTKLIEAGRTFKQPTIKSQESLDGGCAENLFQETTGIDKQKLYGCAAMKMEKSVDNKFIKFNSEVALRKGDDGWIINTFIENHRRVTKSDETKAYRFQFGYIFTKKDLGETKKSESWFFWDASAISSFAHLKLIVPKSEKEVWSASGEYIYDRDVQDIPIFEEPKQFSGAWISDSTKRQESWIFENIEMWINYKNYSEIFCKDANANDCGYYGAAGSETSYKLEDPYSKTWFTNSSPDTSATATNIKQKIKDMINQIKDIRGSWIDLDEMCGWRWHRNLDDEHLNKLKFFCSRKDR